MLSVTEPTYRSNRATTVREFPRRVTQAVCGTLRRGDLVDGKYRIHDVVGEGGMGIVVSARHVVDGREVAIKYLRPELGDDAEIVARFRQEARVTSGLRSEHVVRCLDEGTLESGAPYMVMELLTGIDLGQLMARRKAPLALNDALDYVLQACDALAEAHAHGIVHRDLKPENLFLTQDSNGRPLIKVIDFGMSSSVELERAAGKSESVERTLMGSPPYMSPEHVRCCERADARSDVWALGVVLFELLTGTLLYDEPSIPRLLSRICSEPVPSIRARRTELPRGLERVVERCLEKNPSRRFQSIGALALALRPFVAPFAAPRSEASLAQIAV